ncbi:uncharacterized protein LACBIDRAFT_302398 [Laccaria bicolor S238N-H82]|uniref:Predicted protein n=1 Tax=Laccaria bicolor (strain S238N-H82 / ATCC MYA-4686) TaxID=486041 RepID=B0DHJ4_LACBS|nr:uncharacterized protein LACBIDRAFT_302398 [Laccaria bicolor S238N-H82]EDR05849.1 predicted protein [Laccaria bicolor S238N-H82]|eukprot:XP_001883525.1 predicted protein [Laccaria bicolor S238N-H82]
MPRGVNRNRNRSAFSPEVKRPDRTANILKLLIGKFINIFNSFKTSPRTLNSVRNWCFYKISLVHLLFPKVLRGPTDWSRFEFYAKRVKNFSYIRDPDHLDIALHVYFRIAQLRASPILFPSLQHIRCPSISSNDFLISGICLFLSPSLVAVEMGLVKIILRGEGLGKETMSLIPRFGRLRVLELGGMGKSLRLPSLERVGALSALTGLEVDFINSPIPPLANTVGFRHLRSLCISASLPFIQSFAVNISTDQLDTFVCLSPPEPGFDMKLLVEDVVSRWSSSLRCFGLRLTPEDTEAEELPLDTLKPLFPLQNLRTLSLRGYLMDISDDLIKEWAKTWPNLNDLLLPFLPPTRVRPRMKSL